jgi:predicted SAM-dependent methyltransferase
MIDWLNVDIFPYPKNGYFEKNEILYFQMDLIKENIFPNDFFKFGFSEDFIEHLSQADSIIFLTEAYRTLKKNGVLRISFPGFENVLLTSFKECSYKSAYWGKFDAYTQYEHLHFYSKESIKTVANHIGFRNINFCEYGSSDYSELKGIDNRYEQRETNIIVELLK